MLAFKAFQALSPFIPAHDQVPSYQAEAMAGRAKKESPRFTVQASPVFCYSQKTYLIIIDLIKL
jgi:hypothetical protein